MGNSTAKMEAVYCPFVGVTPGKQHCKDAGGLQARHGVSDVGAVLTRLSNKALAKGFNGFTSAQSWKADAASRRFIPASSHSFS